MFLGVVKATCPVDSNVRGTGSDSLSSAFRTFVDINQKNTSRQRMVDAPMEPPAEIEQNSNRPSNGGLSSMVRTITTAYQYLMTPNL